MRLVSSQAMCHPSFWQFYATDELTRQYLGNGWIQMWWVQYGQYCHGSHVAPLKYHTLHNHHCHGLCQQITFYRLFLKLYTCLRLRNPLSNKFTCLIYNGGKMQVMIAATTRQLYLKGQCHEFFYHFFSVKDSTWASYEQTKTVLCTFSFSRRYSIAKFRLVVENADTQHFLQIQRFSYF